MNSQQIQYYFLWLNNVLFTHFQFVKSKQFKIIL